MKNLKLLPIYFTYIIMFIQASASKLANFGAVPDWFQKQFGATFLNPFSGALALEFYSIAALELIAAVVISVSLFRGEFLAGRPKPLLLWGLLLSGAIFCMLSVGLRVTGDFATASQVFIYCVSSFGLAEFFNQTERPVQS